jgi:hypothetical protein
LSAGNGIDLDPAVKLFTPDASYTWLLTGVDPHDTDRAFALIDLGRGCPDLGYVSLRELEGLRGMLGLHVERDLHFDAERSLSGYAELARQHGRIVT